MILFKMLNRGLASTINGCISTGKEANVYHASGDNGDIAIKVHTPLLYTKTYWKCSMFTIYRILQAKFYLN